MPVTSNPAALSKFGLYTQIGGAVSGGIGSYFSALSQKNADNFQAQMDDSNAFHAANAGQEQASNVLQKGAMVMGAQKASMAANGVVLGDGSAAQVIASTDTMRQVDANTTMNNAMQEAFGYKADAIMKRASASAISPIASAASTLLSSAGNVASQWALKNTKRPQSIGGFS